MRRILLIPVLALIFACNQRSEKEYQHLADSTKLSDSIKNASSVTTSVLDTGPLEKITIDSVSFKNLYKSCRKDGDEFQSDSFLYDYSSPQFVNRNGIFVYINEKGPTLRFAIRYYAEDWLFIKNMTFNVDGSNFDYIPANRFKTDSGDGHIWEWADDVVVDEDLPMMVSIATGEKAKVKFYGTQYYKIVDISQKQRDAFKHILQVYKGLLAGYKK
jgi:hypothetical protein